MIPIDYNAFQSFVYPKSRLLARDVEPSMDVMKSDVVVRKPMCDESVLFSTRFRFGILSITAIQTNDDFISTEM